MPHQTMCFAMEQLSDACQIVLRNRYLLAETND
jgi:hypothetical protein